MFAVIQFSENDGGTVAVVNKNWLTPRRCDVYWPPAKGSKAFDRFLSHQASPDEKWKLYGVQKVFYETDDIEKAKKKLKLVEVSSDIQTEEETEVSKRKPQKTKRYISSSSDSDESDDNFTRPPPFKKQVIRTLQYMNKSDDPSNDLTSDLPILSASLLQGLEQEAGATSTAWPEDIHVLDTPGRNVTATTELSGYQSKVLSLLSLMKTQNDQIIQMLKQNKNCQGTLKEDFKFPIKTAAELHATEQLLLLKENYDNLVSYIKILGGSDAASKVYRILKWAFTDHVAVQYNFYGKRSNKKAFCHLRIRDCYCLIKNKKVFKIFNILKNGCFFVYGREFVNYQPFYEYPFNSVTIDVMEVKELSNFKLIPISEICTKCVVIPDESYTVSIPLLHN